MGNVENFDMLRDWISSWRSSRKLALAVRKSIRRYCNSLVSSPDLLEDRPLPSAFSFTQLVGPAGPLNQRTAGLKTTPSIRDLDADGDLDLISGDDAGKFYYHRNNGTPSSPAFPLTVVANAADNPLRKTDAGSGSYLAWGDLDGDLDLDLIVGIQSGQFRYYVNRGTRSAPSLLKTTGTAHPLNNIDLGSNTTPVLGDLDGDGDLDLVVGERNGSLFYFQNTGTRTAPLFTLQTGNASPFNGLSLGLNSYVNPALVDLDADTDLDLVVGAADGTLSYFKNVGSKTSPQFIRKTGAANPWNGIDLGSFSVPAFGDLDADGDPDLIVGLSTGKFEYFQAAPSIAASAADIELTQTVLADNPGPGTTVTFTLTLKNNGPLDADNLVVSLPGPNGLNDVEFDAETGIYLADHWNVPSLSNGQSASFTFTGTIAAAGSDVSNSAELIVANNADPDSSPDNHLPAEDDQVSNSFHVNANPVLTVSGASKLDPISVNIPDSLNHGTLVSDLIARLGPSGGISDPDPAPLQGLAVNGTVRTNGTWEFTVDGGLTWHDIGPADNDRARLLAADTLTRVRFLPNHGFKGQAKIYFVAWDRTAGENGGLAVTKLRVGSSPLSLAYDSAAITVANAAPVLNVSGIPNLETISLSNLSDSSPSGISILELLASLGPSGGIVDSDPGALRGIAVNGLTLVSSGVWQYTLDAGETWVDFGTVGNSNARLLAADEFTRVRFVPTAAKTGLARFYFVAWDQTSGINGATAIVSSRGGSTAFSLLYYYATVTVTS